MMDESGTDAERLLLRWRQGQLDRSVLYTEVRRPMYQAARSGISSITSSDPDPQDVEVAYTTRSFNYRPPRGHHRCGQLRTVSDPLV